MAEPERRLPLIRQRTVPLQWIEVGTRPSETGGTPTPLPGYLCEACLDAPAVAVVPAPWGGERGVCARCQETGGEG